MLGQTLVFGRTCRLVQQHVCGMESAKEWACGKVGAAFCTWMLLFNRGFTWFTVFVHFER